MAACEPFLFRQIDIIQPRVIVALGKFAAQCLLRSTEPITRLRGREFEYRGATLIPTFHPAYLLRNPSAKREVWEDMKKVRAILLADQRPRRPIRLISVAVRPVPPHWASRACPRSDCSPMRARRLAVPPLAREWSSRSDRGGSLDLVLGEALPLEPSVEVRDILEVLDHESFVPADVVELASLGVRLLPRRSVARRWPPRSRRTG